MCVCLCVIERLRRAHDSRMLPGTEDRGEGSFSHAVCDFIPARVQQDMTEARLLLDLLRLSLAVEWRTPKE